MPYVKQERRREAMLSPENAGELNYALTHLLQDYIYIRGGLSYQIINDCLGALEGAKLEFNRRIVSPYEDKKIKENGDVYS